MPNDSAPFVAGVARSDALGRSGAFHDNILTRQPLSRLATFGRYLNFACAALLLATGGLGLLSAFESVSSLPPTVLLSFYSGGFSALLLRYETASGALAEHLRERYGFMYTYAGRAGFLLLCANLTWTLDPPIGWIAATIVNASAILVGYIVYAHPDFTSGRYLRMAIVDATGTGDINFRLDADPAALAVRAQAGYS